MYYKVNLLPPRLQRDSIVDVRRLVVVAVATLLITTVIGGYTAGTINYFLMKNELSETKKQLVQLAPLVARVEGMKRERTDLEATIVEYDTILKKQVAWSDLLYDLGDIVPVDIWLTGMDVANKAELKTLGAASPFPQAGIKSGNGKTPEKEEGEGQPPAGQLKAAASSGQQQKDPEVMPRPNAVTLSGYSRTMPSIGVFINNLYRLPYFKEVKLNKITAENEFYKFEINTLVRDDI